MDSQIITDSSYAFAADLYEVVALIIYALRYS